MNEVISSILVAEKSADEKIDKANSDARAVIATADAEAEKIKGDAICLFKANKRLKLAKAEREAQQVYDNRIEEGKNQAKKVKDCAQKKTDSVCEFIVNDILG